MEERAENGGGGVAAASSFQAMLFLLGAGQRVGNS